MPKAYSYVRFSHPDQARGDSLRRQLESSSAWAEIHGYELDTSLRDLGVSAFRGANRARGALRAFLERVEAGDIEQGSVLIVESLDRLSRQQILESLSLFTSLLSAGIEVVTLADGRRYTQDSISDVGELIISLVVMSRAHEESATKSMRAAASWTRKREQALEKPLTAALPAWLTLDRERGEIRAIPERAAIVKEIFTKSAAGLGVRAIVAQFNERREEPWGKSSGWHHSYARKILSNRAVIGEYQPHTGRGSARRPLGDPISGYYPALVDEALFYRAANARQGRQGEGGRRGRRFSNLLTGLCFCGECGEPMRYLNKGQPPRGGTYLACDGYLRRLGCANNAHFRYEKVERILLIELAQIADWYSGISGGENKRASAQEALDAVEAESANTAEQLTRYAALFESAGSEAELSFARARYVELMSKHEQQRAAVEQQRTALAGLSDESPAARAAGLSRALFELEARKTMRAAFDGGPSHYERRAAANRALRDLVAKCLFFNKKDGLSLTWLLHDGREDVLALSGAAGELLDKRTNDEKVRAIIAGVKAELDRIEARDAERAGRLSTE